MKKYDNIGQIIEFRSDICDVNALELSKLQIKIASTLAPYSFFPPDESLLGHVTIVMNQVRVSDLEEISGQKIESKDDIYQVAEKVGYKEFPNGLLYLMCAYKGRTVRDMLIKENKSYHILVKRFVHLYQPGATLSLVRDDDDCLCFTPNSGFPSAIGPDDIWWMLKSISVYRRKSSTSIDSITTSESGLKTV